MRKTASNISRISDLGELELIGRGGMAEVFRARRTSDGRLVAVKVLTEEAMQHPNFVRRFEREGETLTALDHPHIVRGLRTGVVRGRPYLVMEYVPGASVADLVQHSGPLPLARALALTTQVAQALQYAHGKGFVHRDVKPSNILLADDDHAKLSDFGLAKLEDDSSVTIDGSLLGTPYYLAPEQISGSPRIDARADIYSLGMTLYFLLVGEPAFKAPTIPAVLTRHLTDEIRFAPELYKRLPEPVIVLVRRMAAKQPERRYQSMDEVLLDLAWARGEADEPCPCTLPADRDFYLLDSSAEHAPVRRWAEQQHLHLPLPDSPHHRISVEAGAVLFYEDEPSSEIYWLESGRVEVLRGGRRLAVLDERGTLLGELAALRGSPRAVTARAISDCVLVRVESAELPHYLAEHPDVLRALLREMAERIDRGNHQVAAAEETMEALRRTLTTIAAALTGGDMTAPEAAALLRQLSLFDATIAQR
jgi:CRP-like cAMP-binding protein/tRNA A-37 threonylcarbamoyl transferase component Bud32